MKIFRWQVVQFHQIYLWINFPHFYREYIEKHFSAQFQSITYLDFFTLIFAWGLTDFIAILLY